MQHHHHLPSVKFSHAFLPPHIANILALEGGKVWYRPQSCRHAVNLRISYKSATCKVLVPPTAHALPPLDSPLARERISSMQCTRRPSLGRAQMRRSRVGANDRPLPGPPSRRFTPPAFLVPVRLQPYGASRLLSPLPLPFCAVPSSYEEGRGGEEGSRQSPPLTGSVPDD